MYGCATRFVYFVAELRPLEVVELVRGGGRPNIPPPETPLASMLVPLMIKCWDASPEARPSFSDVLAFLEERDSRLMSPGARIDTEAVSILRRGDAVGT